MGWSSPLAVCESCCSWRWHCITHELLLLFADCGAGVGRVSEQLLLHHFALVDLLEPSRHLLDTAITNLTRAIDSGTYPPGRRLGQQLCCGLQQFTPEAGRWGTHGLCAGEGTVLARSWRMSMFECSSRGQLHMHVLGSQCLQACCLFCLLA